MKTVLQPLYFSKANEREHTERAGQLAVLEGLYGEECSLLPELVLGSAIPGQADAIVFPQLIGAVFSHREEMQLLGLPIVVLTSEFGTVEMWDWEIVSWLRGSLGLTVFTPYNIDLGKTILRAIASKKSMREGARFLMFQDSPGEGQQAYIFKRFFWWEQESAQAIEDAFGVKILYRSWREVNEQARAIPDEEALAVWAAQSVPEEGVPQAGIIKATKLYMAIKRVIDELGGVEGVGSNCLNESFHSDSTPCLAWNWLFERDGIIWACEGDTVTLISKFIFYSAMRAPLMMTNIYPFLVGMAAIKHEKIAKFPDVFEPDNCALGVHCGYFGFAPQSFCTHWTMRPKVLEIVADDAIMIDCRMPAGPITMAKLHADMKKLTIIEAEIEEYVQFSGSDCLNGALLRYTNKSGHRVMESLSSHHAILIQGRMAPQLSQIAKVYGFETEII